MNNIGSKAKDDLLVILDGCQTHCHRCMNGMVDKNLRKNRANQIADNAKACLTWHNGGMHSIPTAALEVILDLAPLQPFVRRKAVLSALWILQKNT